MRVHPVFHTGLLKPYITSERNKEPVPIMMEDCRELFEIDGLRGERVKTRRGRKSKDPGKVPREKSEFLVRWLGYGPEHDSWEPEEGLQGARWTISEYRKNVAVDRTKVG